MKHDRSIIKWLRRPGTDAVNGKCVLCVSSIAAGIGLASLLGSGSANADPADPAPSPDLVAVRDHDAVGDEHQALVSNSHFPDGVPDLDDHVARRAADPDAAIAVRDHDAVGDAHQAAVSNSHFPDGVPDLDDQAHVPVRVADAAGALGAGPVADVAAAPASNPGLEQLQELLSGATAAGTLPDAADHGLNTAIAAIEAASSVPTAADLVP